MCVIKPLLPLLIHAAAHAYLHSEIIHDLHVIDG